MKECPYCNSEISDGSLFCGNCGKKLLQEKFCVKCGKSINANSEFCTYCGAKQHEGTKPRVKKEIKVPKSFKWIIVGILALTLLGGVTCYWFEIREDYSLEGLARITTGEYELRDFYNGYAAIVRDYNMGVINKQGKIIAPCTYRLVGNWNSYGHSCLAVMSEDRIRLAKESYGKITYGYIDKKGNEVIPFVYENAENFSEGLAMVKKKGKWGYINKEGKEIIPFVYEGAASFYNGRAVVSKNLKQCTFIDQSGNVVEALKYDWYSYCNFSRKGMCLRYNGKMGFINKNGKLVTPLIYDDIDTKIEGDLIPVMKDGISGCINMEGKEVIPYDMIIVTEGKGAVIEGLAWAERNGLYGYLDKNDKEVIPFIYDDANSFSDGLARVKKDGRWGYIDKKGKSTFDYQ